MIKEVMKHEVRNKYRNVSTTINELNINSDDMSDPVCTLVEKLLIAGRPFNLHVDSGGRYARFTVFDISNLGHQDVITYTEE